MTQTHRTKRTLWLAAALALAGLAAWAPPVVADGNAGTVKVQDDSDTGNMSNDPHVGCSFSVEGFNMAAASGTLSIQAWPPTGDRSEVLAANWTADADSDATGNHFVAGEFSLPSGHYKVSASNEQHAKTKVFWVDCPNASVPVFPTTTALTIGTTAALGGAFLILRRRP
ncbi:MAG: hypothetical protein V4510_08845 [bacterium]